jgi:hypothetical protein
MVAASLVCRYSAALVQSVFRGYSARKPLVEARRMFEAYVATLIQRSWRRASAEARYNVFLFGLVSLQAACRGRRARAARDALMAAAIQRNWRRKRAELRYALALAGFTRLQAVARGRTWRVGRDARIKREAAVLLLQSVARGWAVRAVLKREAARIMKLMRRWG